MSKRKEILHLNSDEIAIVWDVDMWRHLILTYESCAEFGTEEDKPFWMDAAQHIREALDAAPSEWDDE